MISTCFLCGIDLEPGVDRFQVHPEREDCLVKFTDELGIAVEAEFVPALDEP
jgi:hypothetical protein